MTSNDGGAWIGAKLLAGVEKNLEIFPYEQVRSMAEGKLAAVFDDLALPALGDAVLEVFRVLAEAEHAIYGDSSEKSVKN